MAVTHPTATRNVIADAFVDLLDGGTIEFLTASAVAAATLALSTPAFGSASSGIATANAITQDDNAVGGVVVSGQIKDSGGVVRVAFSVTALGGGGDVEIDNVTIFAGQVVKMTSLTYEACP